MTTDGDPWKSAVGAWVRLSCLWAQVERELGIAPGEAAKVLRPALENLAIKTQVRDLNQHDRLHLSRPGWIALLPGDQHPSLTGDGWRELGREGGLNPRLKGNDIWVNWPQTVAALEGIPRNSVARLAVAGTIGSETALARWLTQRMSESLRAPRPKSNMRGDAEEAGFNVSKRMFDRAWSRSVEASSAHAWSLPGPRPKSPQ